MFFGICHIIHHSSEEFNLACALRQSISVIVQSFCLPVIACGFIGCTHNRNCHRGPLHLFAQFWYHTQHINKMGFLEKIIVTPSHHRVHHAINKEYIDKNLRTDIYFLGQTVWHLPERIERSAAGLWDHKTGTATWNPIKINFQHLWLLMKDAWRTKSWKDKFTLWFKPTGYRPADVAKNTRCIKLKTCIILKNMIPESLNGIEYMELDAINDDLIFCQLSFWQYCRYQTISDSSYIFWYGGFYFPECICTDRTDGQKPLCYCLGNSSVWPRNRFPRLPE